MKMLNRHIIPLLKILSIQDAADIALVVLNRKPVALFEVAYKKKSKRTLVEFRRAVTLLRKQLTALGLFSYIRPNFPKTKTTLTHYSVVSKKKTKLQSALRAEKIKDSKKRRMAIGRLLGYPKSAVLSFANNSSINTNDIPANILRKPEITLLNFRLSKNWRKELPYLRKNMQVIKKNAPELYLRILKGR